MKQMEVYEGGSGTAIAWGLGSGGEADASAGVVHLFLFDRFFFL